MDWKAGIIATLEKARRILADELDTRISSYCTPVDIERGTYDRTKVCGPDEEAAIAEVEEVLMEIHKHLYGAVPAGTRVRIKEDVELYPHGIFKAGLTGTVQKIFLDYVDEGPVASIQLDQHFPELDEWDNEIHLLADPYHGPTWTNFEKIE